MGRITSSNLLKAGLNPVASAQWAPSLLAYEVQIETCGYAAGCGAKPAHEAWVCGAGCQLDPILGHRFAFVQCACL